jgi:uncharacterized protein YigA (DUF484 family)
MTHKPNFDQTDNLVDEQHIIEYLRTHRDFLERHPDLLIDMQVPHDSGSGISLIERQVDALRESNEALRRKLRALIDTAKQNESLNQQLHEVLLAIIVQDDLDAALDVLTETIKDQFDVPLAVIRFAVDDQEKRARAEITDKADIDYQQLHARVAHGKSVCDDRLPTQTLKYLFADQAEKVGSCALVPLGTADPLGVLALASLDKSRFRADLGTLFLDRLGVVVGVVLQRLLG